MFGFRRTPKAIETKKQKNSTKKLRVVGVFPANLDELDPSYRVLLQELAKR